MRIAARKTFEVFKLSSPNGKKWWKIEGRPTGRRERYYFKTEKEAKKGAADRNNQIVAFGSQVALPETERVMAGVYQIALSLREDVVRCRPFLPEPLRAPGFLYFYW